MYPRTNRCYNERGCRTNYFRSIIPHCIPWSVIWCSRGNGRGRNSVVVVATRLQAERSGVRIPARETDFFSKKPSIPPLGTTQHTSKYVPGAKTEVKNTWNCTSTFPTRLDRVDRETFTFFPRKWVSKVQSSWMNNTLQNESGRFLRNSGTYVPNYTASNPRRPNGAPSGCGWRNGLQYGG